ncbi:hypothetical protein ALC53_04708 [Atta colombica]|uniref:Uncharacterized protein n=1 Tax=Atta colombica TaxID=520822 RepID=A0A195BL79_9HYME|nr:hypothetical protein ALC53_04708 [Atta colombica]
MLQTLSGTVQCFVARSTYWITMNPLTMRHKALKVVLRPLPLSTTTREKVNPHVAEAKENYSRNPLQQSRRDKRKQKVNKGTGYKQARYLCRMRRDRNLVSSVLVASVRVT